MIQPNSRYSTATVSRLPAKNGELRSTIIPASTTAQRIRYTEYRLQQGDEITSIAYQRLGNAQLWWIIAEANPEIIWWADVPAGRVIRIPHNG